VESRKVESRKYQNQKVKAKHPASDTSIRPIKWFHIHNKKANQINSEENL
jgi:hypothetical protein